MQPTINDFQKTYIELIAKKTADEVVKELEKRLGKQLDDGHKERKDIDKRLQKVERKVFNGFGLKLDKLKWQIGLLYGIYSVMLGVLIKLAFFG